MTLLKLYMVLSLLSVNISLFSSGVQVLEAMKEDRRKEVETALVNFQNDSAKNSESLEKIKSECQAENEHVLPYLASGLCYPGTTHPNPATVYEYCAVMSMSNANKSIMSEIDKALATWNNSSSAASSSVSSK